MQGNFLKLKNMSLLMASVLWVPRIIDENGTYMIFQKTGEKNYFLRT